MQKKLLFTLLLALGISTAQAQKLVCDHPTLNCGKTSYMVPITATFELQNKSSRRVFIEDVHPDCGCTKVNVSKTELGGGEKCTIKLSYDARMLGHFEKTAAVTYRGRQSEAAAPVFLKMKGVVLTELTDYSGTYPYAMGDLLADKNVLEFDDVNKGDHPQQIINVVNNGDRLMQPNIQHLPSYLEAESVPTELLPGKSGKIVLTLNSESIHDFGLTQTTVHLASQLGEIVSSETEVPVSVVLLPDLTNFEGKNKQYAPKMTLSTDSLILGLVDGKLRKKGELTITNSGRVDLDISSIQMFTGGLRLTLGKRILQPGEQTKLKITANLAQLKKARSKPRVLMITNDPDASKVVIPIIVKSKK